MPVTFTEVLPASKASPNRAMKYSPVCKGVGTVVIDDKRSSTRYAVCAASRWRPSDQAGRGREPKQLPTGYLPSPMLRGRWSEIVERYRNLPYLIQSLPDSTPLHPAIQREALLVSMLARQRGREAVSCLGPKDFDFGDGAVLTGFTTDDLELLHAVKKGGASGLSWEAAAKQLGKSQKAVSTQLSRLQGRINDNQNPTRYVEAVNGKLVIVALDRPTKHPQ